MRNAGVLAYSPKPNFSSIGSFFTSETTSSHCPLTLPGVVTSISSSSFVRPSSPSRGGIPPGEPPAVAWWRRWSRAPFLRRLLLSERSPRKDSSGSIPTTWARGRGTAAGFGWGDGFSAIVGTIGRRDDVYRSKEGDESVSGFSVALSDSAHLQYQSPSLLISTPTQGRPYLWVTPCQGGPPWYSLLKSSRQ